MRYATRFCVVEINSTFRRRHRASTFARWGSEVPPAFRFSVKLPKAITHERQLVDVDSLLDDFMADATTLGERLGCLLVQLPPKLGFEDRVAAAFFRGLRQRFGGAIALEPRHASWLAPAVDALLADIGVARVAADPALDPAAARPGGWPGLAYYRLHGSPRMYYSSYSDGYLEALAATLAGHRAHATAVCCIFDNTAHGAAMTNALALLAALGRGAEPTEDRR